MSPVQLFNVLQSVLLCLILLSFMARDRSPAWEGLSGPVNMALLGLSMLANAWRAKAANGEWSQPFLLLSGLLLLLGLGMLRW